MQLHLYDWIVQYFIHLMHILYLCIYESAVSSKYLNTFIIMWLFPIKQKKKCFIHTFKKEILLFLRCTNSIFLLSKSFFIKYVKVRDTDRDAFYLFFRPRVKLNFFCQNWYRTMWLKNDSSWRIMVWVEYVFVVRYQKTFFFHLGQNKYHNCFGRALFVGEIQSKYLKAEEAPAH